VTTGTVYPWAAGFVESGNRPQVVTSRFKYEDSYTLERYHATGGYEGLKQALSKPAPAVHDDVKGATVLGRDQVGADAPRQVPSLPRRQW
jgi:NADH-quinone oxidoreductase subunit F